LAVAALVVLLVGALAGLRDKYFAFPSDSRTSPVRMPQESWYNFPHDAPLALSPDSVRYLHLDLRRLAKPGLHTAVRQEHVCSGMSGGVLPVSLPGEPLFRTVGNDSTLYRPPRANQLQHFLTQIPEDFQMCFKVWEEITIPSYAK
jgi:hypothetical protein